MIYTLKYALAFVIIALTLSTPAKADSTTAGTPITAENVVAHSDIIRIADTLDSAVDAKDWALARSLFTDQIEVDFTSLVGGEPANIASDDLISGWSANLKGDKSSFHMRSNHRITFQDANNATMTSHGYAWNKMERGAAPENGGNPLWEVWGTYEHGFVRTAEGWRINAMSFNALTERGSKFVRNTPGE